jgi:dihydrodipicolinate reductase
MKTKLVVVGAAGRMEPRMVRREWQHYPQLKMARTQWRQKHVA